MQIITYVGAYVRLPWLQVSVLKEELEKARERIAQLEEENRSNHLWYVRTYVCIYLCMYVCMYGCVSLVMCLTGGHSDACTCVRTVPTVLAVH